jgi:hypothetical protein
MIKKMEQAVKAGDREAARALIVQELWEHPGRPATLDMVTYAMENMPDLFDEEVGTLVIEERENWDEEYRESPDPLRGISRATGSNFSQKSPPPLSRRKHLMPNQYATKDIRP